jgi:predicted outer membrane repeat protein
MRVHAAALVFVLSICPVILRADAVVTLCSVDTQAGSGVNLRDAVAMGGRITFSCPANTVIRVTARRTIDSVIEIDGGNNVTLDAGGTTSLFRSSSGLHNRTLTIRNIGIKGGKTDADGFVPPGTAGAITISFTGGVNHAVFDHVQISGTENAISIPFGSVTVTNSQFAGDSGRVLQVGNDVGEAASLDVHHVTITGVSGEAFWSIGATVLIEDATVSGNTDSTGRASEFSKGTLEIHNSRFSNTWNSATCGGAINTSSRTIIANTTFTNNRSNCGGGAVYIAGPASAVDLHAVTFTGNQTAGRGGAVAFENLTGKVQIVHGEFRNNSAAWGGAVSAYYSAPSPVVVNAAALSFKANTASQGGGAFYIENVGLQLTRGIFVDNKAKQGAALMLAGAGPQSLVLGNAIVARNASSSGAAIQAISGRIVNSTIAGNQGAGLSSAGSVQVINTVISGSTAKNCVSAGGTIADGGANVQFPGTDCPATIPVADPLLDNFYVPDLNSPLQRAGNNAACMALPVSGVDVYGQVRPKAIRCDIGAVEGDIETVLNKVGINASTPGLTGKGRGRHRLPSVWWLFLLLVILLIILLCCRVIWHFSIWKLILVTFLVLVIAFLGYQLR